MELIEAKTKLDLLRKAQRNSNSDNSATSKIMEKVQELRRNTTKNIEFEATPDPEYDIQDIEGEIPNEQKNL